MAEWADNPAIVWRIVIQHYPMFTLDLPQSDIEAIEDVFLPILKNHKFDLYICGQEHSNSFTYIPHTAASIKSNTTDQNEA